MNAAEEHEYATESLAECSPAQCALRAAFIIIALRPDAFW